MQKQFVIPIFTKEGRCFNLQVKQKFQNITKRKVKTWTTQQDNLLLQLYQKYPKRWNDIANQMNDRNQNQCLHRYRRLHQLGKNHKIWSSEEDETVKRLIKKYGKNWKLLSQMLGSKNGKQIRQRFINKLDPKIKKQDWTEQEDKKIVQLYSLLGSKWSQISKQLPGRPENKIKNRFYSFIQKNYDIKFKEMQNIDPNPKGSYQQQEKIKNQLAVKSQNKLIPFGSYNFNSEGYSNRQDLQIQQKVCSKFEIPSINEFQLDLKNQNFVSQNLIQSYIRVDEQWKSNSYQGFLQLNSNQHFKNLKMNL